MKSTVGGVNLNPTGSIMHPQQQQQQQQQQQAVTLNADQAYQLIGLLIVEGRLPQVSPKGRVEGPHATKTDAHSHDDHVCVPLDSPLCKKAERYSQQLSRVGQALMPVSVDVLLLPECESGQQAASATENECCCSTSEATECASILLESWIIQVSHTRSRDGALSLKMLLQAMRSYLGFSQLSAWFVRSGGQFPKNIMYRISVLDDTDSRFASANACSSVTDGAGCFTASSGPLLLEFEQRTFPTVALANDLLLTVSLNALKRQLERPIVSCRRPTCGDCHKQQQQQQLATLPASPPQQSTVTVPATPTLSPPRAIDESAAMKSTSAALGDSPSAQNSPSPSISNSTASSAALTQSSSSLSLSLMSITSPYSQPSLPQTPAECSTSGEKADRPTIYSGVVNQTPTSSLLMNSAARRRLVFTDDNQNTVRASESGSGQAQFDCAKKSTVGEPPTRKNKMRDERKILFSDSSSNESLDRLEFRVRDRRWPVTPLAASDNAPTTALRPTTVTVATAKQLPPATTEEQVPPTFLSSESKAQQRNLPVCNPSGEEVANAAIKLRSLSVSESVEQASGVNERTPRRRCSKSTSVSKPSVRPPSDSSPAPIVRAGTGRFDCVQQPLRRCGLSLPSPLASELSDLARSAPSSSSARLNRLNSNNGLTVSTVSVDGSGQPSFTTTDNVDADDGSVPPPATASGYLVAQNLVVNFEESLLNGRISPIGSIDGFSVTLSAAGAQFSTPHVSLPVTAEFFRLSDDNSPSPYLGRAELGPTLGKHGFRVPLHGVLQVTLFNPNSTVMKMFVVVYDLSAMPPLSQTFLRQRTYYMPVKPLAPERDSTPQRRLMPKIQQPDSSTVDGQRELPSYLRYVIHLRLQTSKRGHLYLHKDIRMIIARDAFEFDPQVARYELRSILDQPTNPTFSPIR